MASRLIGNPLRSGWYKRAFETAPVGMCFADSEFKLTEVNKALCTMLSYSADELIGMTVLEITHPEDVNRSIEKMQKLFSGNSNTFKLEKRYLSKDGSIVWGLTTVSVSEMGEGGKVRQSFAVVQDITTKKRLEMALKESENNYHTMIEMAPDAVAVHKDGLVAYINSAGVKLLGATKVEQIVGKPTLTFVHSDSLKEVTERIKIMTETGKSVPSLEEKFLRLDGSPVDVEVVATPVTFRGEKAIQVIVHDISESKKIRDELRSSEMRYRNLAEAANDMIFTLDKSGTITYLNSFAAASFRKKPEDFIGKNKADFFGEEISKKQNESIAEVYRTGKPVYRETQTPLGGVKWWLSTWLVPLRGDNGEITGILGVSRDITQLKTVADKLASNERLLSRAQVAARLGVYEFDVLTGRWKSSGLLDQIFGIDKQYPHSLEGWLKIVHPDSQAELYEYLNEEVIGKKQPFEREYRIVRQNDGEERWVHGMGDLEIDNEGRVVQMVGTIQDITDRKIGEAAVVKEKETTDYILNSLPGIYYLFDQNGKFRRWNNNLIQVGEYPVAEMLVRTPADFFSEEEKGLITKQVKAVFEKGYSEIEANLVTKSGKRIPYFFNGARIVVNGEPMVSGMGVDITHRKKTEEALALSSAKLETVLKVTTEDKARLEAILDGTIDGVLVVDKDGKVILFNRAAETITGHTLVEVFGEPYWEKLTFTPLRLAGKDPDFVRKALTGKVVETVEDYTIAGKENKTLFVEASASPVRVASGEMVGVVIVFRDISKRKETEKMRDEFMLVAAHELRAPMTAIKWLVSMIIAENYGPVDEKLKKPLIGVSDSVSRLINLVNDMISISRVESGQLKLLMIDFDIKKLIDGVAVTFGPEITKKGLVLDTNEVKSLTVRADLDKTTQIISNLIDNAIKFTEKGKISIGTSSEGRVIKISVSDTGLGIPPEFVDKLFSKFSQAVNKVEGKPKGTGLGLYISRELAKEMRGNLVLVSSKLGKGSVFEVTLPAVGR